MLQQLSRNSGKAREKERMGATCLEAEAEWLLLYNLFITDEKLGRKGNLAKVACKTFPRKLFRRWENEIFINFFSPCRIRHNLMKESYDQIRRFSNNNLHEPWFFIFCGCQQPRSIKVSSELSHMWWNEIRQRTYNSITILYLWLNPSSYRSVRLRIRVIDGLFYSEKERREQSRSWKNHCFLEE